MGYNLPMTMTINEQINADVSVIEHIVLSTDTTENVVIPNGKNVTIDLNGHTLQNDTTGDKNEYTITNLGSLRIVDSIGGGNVYNAGTKNKGCLVNLKGGNVVIDKGRFWTDAPRTTGAWYYIVNMGQSMIINDAEVPGVAPNASTVRNGFYTDQERAENYVEGHYPALIINGGTFTGQLIPVKNDEGGYLEINGGRFEGPSESVLNWNVARITGGIFIAPDNKYVIYSGAYTTDISEGKLDISGGTFTGGSGIYDLTPQYAPDKSDTAYNYITGGKWEVANKYTVTEFIKPGYEYEMDEEGNIIIQKELEWTFPEGGSMALGMVGNSRVYVHNDSVEYEEGGFDVPVRGFTPKIVLATAQGGCDGYYNSKTKKIQLFRNGVEISERLYDVTLLMFGN